jgi:hypothetical protein
MLQLRTVIGTDIQDRNILGTFFRKKSVNPLVSYVFEVLTQRARHAREIGVITEHDFFGNRVIKLNG